MVAGIDCDGLPYRFRLDDGQTIAARVVVVATGARYRKLDVPNYAKFEGQGIHYAATAMEAQLCAGEEVVVVGGGNSAGQAAVFLSRTAAHVHILVRASGLAATMSDYLVQRIAAVAEDHAPRPHRDHGARGRRLACGRSTWTNRDTGASETAAIGNVFVMIGAEPNTDWLDGCLDLDAKGFVQTGKDADGTRARLALRDDARRASSPSATSARARSSASPRRRAKAPSWSRRSTSSSTPAWSRRQ